MPNPLDCLSPLTKTRHSLLTNDAHNMQIRAWPPGYGWSGVQISQFGAARGHLDDQFADQADIGYSAKDGYGSEGWGFESLRARYWNRRSQRCPGIATAPRSCAIPKNPYSYRDASQL